MPCNDRNTLYFRDAIYVESGGALSSNGDLKMILREDKARQCSQFEKLLTDRTPLGVFPSPAEGRRMGRPFLSHVLYMMQ